MNADNDLSFPYPQYVRKEGYFMLMTQHHSASAQKQENCLFFYQTNTTNPYFVLISQRHYRTQTDKSVSQSKAITSRFVDYRSRLNEAGSLSKKMAVN